MMYAHNKENLQECKYCQTPIKSPDDYTKSYFCHVCKRDNCMWNLEPLPFTELPTKSIPATDMLAYEKNQQAGDRYKESETLAFFAKYPEFEKAIKKNLKASNFNNYQLIKLTKHLELRIYSIEQREALKTQIIRFLDSYRGNIASAYTLQCDEIMKKANEKFTKPRENKTETFRQDWDN